MSKIYIQQDLRQHFNKEILKKLNPDYAIDCDEML